jgi:hypothetical protein
MADSGSYFHIEMSDRAEARAGCALLAAHRGFPAGRHQQADYIQLKLFKSLINTIDNPAGGLIPGSALQQPRKT